MTFEDVDKHVNNVTLPPINPAQSLQQLCVYYQAVKPILTMVENFPFFPPKWKAVLTGFTALLDVLCPSN